MLISKNTNTDFFTVNGTANASECGVFNDLYDVIGPQSKQEFCSLPKTKRYSAEKAEHLGFFAVILLSIAKREL